MKLISFAAWVALILPLRAQAVPMAKQWKLSLSDGAVAGLESTSERARVTKSNARGSVLLRWPVTFPVKKGQQVLFRVPYHSEDASVMNLLLVRPMLTPDAPPKINVDIDGFALWTGQSLMRNSAPSQWDERITPFSPEADGEVTLHVALYGNPCTVEIGEPKVEPYRKIPPTQKDYGDSLAAGAAQLALAGRKNSTAHIAAFNGRCAMWVNDQPVAPMLYKGIHATTDRGDYTGFANDGVNLATIAIATGKTSHEPKDGIDPIWLDKDKMALGKIDEALLRVLQRNRNANIILDIRIDPYQAWGKEHPGEIIRNAKGEGAYGPTDYVGKYTADPKLVNDPKSGKFWIPSWQSEIWRADLEMVFTRIAEHVKQSPYGKAVVGFFITGGDDGQFVIGYHDHSQPTQRAFQAWLKMKYVTLEKINAAWETKLTDWGQAKVPDQEWQDAAMHYAPGPQPDFRTFRERNPWEVRERLAAALKKVVGKPVIVLTYAAPYHPAFAESKWIDGVGMQPDYAHRRPGFPMGFNPVAASSVGNKLLFTELDLRSHTGEGWPTTELYLEWVSVPHSADEWRVIHRKVAGFSIAAGYADWYYDMGQYFNDPAVHAEIAAVRKVKEKLLATPKSKFRPDVCVVVTENDKRYLTDDDAIIPYDEVNFNPQYQALAASGVPFERCYLNEVLARPALQDFKVYVFLQNAYLSNGERDAIREKVQNRKRTLVWVYNSGYISEAGKSIEAMSELVGIQLATGDKPDHRTMEIKLPGIRPFANGAELFWNIFGKTSPGAQPFWVTDADVRVMACYAENGQCAAAQKKRTDWNSIYIGAPQGLSDDLFNAIAREAGAYVAGPAGQQIAINGEFASVHTLRAGEVVLKLPPGRKHIMDADTGKRLATDVSEYRFSVSARQTHWFLFQ